MNKDKIIRKYIKKINIDFPEDDKLYIDLSDMINEILINKDQHIEWFFNKAEMNSERFIESENFLMEISKNPFNYIISYFKIGKFLKHLLTKYNN